jgi:hypoxanthine phosphoribosyltransferase
VTPPSLADYGTIAQDIREIVLTADQIQERVKEIAQAITGDYAGCDLLLVGALKGVVVFMSDLIRNIDLPLQVDFISVASYSAESRRHGYVRFIKDLDKPIEGKHVLFVEDVIDTGLTLNYILRNLRIREPASLQVCVLFNKPSHRLIDIPVKYKGFDLPDKFVAGYGLDYRERYRGLPFVGILKPQALESAE